MTWVSWSHVSSFKRLTYFDFNNLVNDSYCEIAPKEYHDLLFVLSSY